MLRCWLTKLKQQQPANGVLQGEDALETIASHDEVDAVMAAIVGAAGLGLAWLPRAPASGCCWPTRKRWWSAANSSCDTVREGGATLLPIDSEHSAIFQSLPEDPATWARRIDKIILTASGGPFRTRAGRTRWRAVTPEQACAHPNWVDGAQDLGRLGDHDEQGARGDRGAPPVRRRAGADRGGDPSAERGALDGAVHRCLGDRAARHARHARADRGGPGLARPHRERCRAARLPPPWPR